MKYQKGMIEMKKFDENNNPIFSKKENFFIYMTLFAGYLIIFSFVVIVSSVYLYAIYDFIKKLIVEHSLLLGLILFIAFHFVILLIKLYKSK